MHNIHIHTAHVYVWLSQIEIIPHKFVKLGEVVVIVVDQELVNKYHITEDDWALQKDTGNGILLEKLTKRKQ